MSEVKAASGIGTVRDRPGKGWVTKLEALELQDIAENTWERTYRVLLPAEAEQQFEGRLWIYYPTFLEALVGHKIKVDRTTRKGGGGDDDLGAMMGDRDALARTQRAKAEQEELKLGMMKGELVNKEQMKAAMAPLTSILRRAMESLERMFGSEAASILREAIDEWVAGVEKLFRGRP